MRTMNEIKQIVIKYLQSCCQQGSWQCYGAGEIGCEITFYHPITDEQQFVAEMFGDNGTNTFYNPEGEPWTDDYPEEQVQNFCQNMVENMDYSEIYAVYSKALMHAQQSMFLPWLLEEVA